MATLEDNDDPYWCAAWNKGCCTIVRDRFLVRVRILDEDNQPLHPSAFQVVQQVRPAMSNEHDSSLRVFHQYLRKYMGRLLFPELPTWRELRTDSEEFNYGLRDYAFLSADARMNAYGYLDEKDDDLEALQGWLAGLQAAIESSGHRFYVEAGRA